MVQEQLASLKASAARLSECYQSRTRSVIDSLAISTMELTPAEQAALDDFVEESKACLLHTCLSADDITELEEEYDEYSLTMIGLWILNEESLCVPKGTRADVGSCLLTALGGDLFNGIATAFGNYSWRALGKVAVKVALKQFARAVAGPAAAFVIAGTFTLCMLGD